MCADPCTRARCDGETLTCVHEPFSGDPETTIPCSQENEYGVCRGVFERCTDGVLGWCSAEWPEKEWCDVALVDEDCDGEVNEGCPCPNGQLPPCK